MLRLICFGLMNSSRTVSASVSCSALGCVAKSLGVRDSYRHCALLTQNYRLSTNPGNLLEFGIAPGNAGNFL